MCNYLGHLGRSTSDGNCDNPVCWCHSRTVRYIGDYPTTKPIPQAGIEQLIQRVQDIERRLAELERQMPVNYRLMGAV
jgi:hypothetical protein